MLVFIDESGYPRANDDNEYSTLMGVCIYEKDIKKLNRSIFQLKERIYANQDEIKSTNVIRKQTIEKNRTKNKQYAEEFVDIATSSNITTFSIIMKRPTADPETQEGILPKQYHLLIKKIEYFSEIRNIDKAIFVFDETNEGNDLKIAQNFTGFLYKSRLGKSFTRILEMPLFVSSKVTPAIQIADMFAGITRQYYQNQLHVKSPETEFEKWLSQLFHKIENKTENIKQPNNLFIEYGFQLIDNLNYIKRNKIS